MDTKKGELEILRKYWRESKREYRARKKAQRKEANQDGDVFR